MGGTIIHPQHSPHMNRIYPHLFFLYCLLTSPNHMWSEDLELSLLKVILCILSTKRNRGKLQHSPAKNSFFSLHIEHASCSKFCCWGGHCTQWMLAHYHLLPHTLLQWVSRMCCSACVLHNLNTSGIWRVNAMFEKTLETQGENMVIQSLPFWQQNATNDDEQSRWIWDERRPHPHDRWDWLCLFSLKY